MDVTITMTAESEWGTAFSALVKAGAHVRTYKDSSSVLYIHAKAVVADGGRAGQQMFVGSETLSTASRRNLVQVARLARRPCIHRNKSTMRTC